MSRKLKPPHKRKPDVFVTHNEILREVSKETGYDKTEVEKVIDAWLAKLRGNLLERRSIKLRNIGTLFPMVRPPRKVTHMGGSTNNYKAMLLEARWTIRFQEDAPLRDQVRDIMVTKKDLDKIYYKQ
jgi:nucleoid DNA-binding protein